MVKNSLMQVMRAKPNWRPASGSCQRAKRSMNKLMIILSWCFWTSCSMPGRVLKKAEGRRQKAEGRKQKAESRKQKAESRKQKAESRKQKAESRSPRGQASCPRRRQGQCWRAAARSGQAGTATRYGSVKVGPGYAHGLRAWSGFLCLFINYAGVLLEAITGPNVCARLIPVMRIVEFQ